MRRMLRGIRLPMGWVTHRVLPHAVWRRPGEGVPHSDGRRGQLSQVPRNGTHIRQRHRSVMQGVTASERDEHPLAISERRDGVATQAVVG